MVNDSDKSPDIKAILARMRSPKFAQGVRAAEKRIEAKHAEQKLNQKINPPDPHTVYGMAA